MSRPLRLLSLSAVVAGFVVGLATPAVAATAAITPTSRTITGDVTGDGVADQVTLGADTAAPGTCSARLRTGRATGGFLGNGYVPLPVRGSSVLACPDLGVVLSGPTPAQDRLAVAWSSVAPLGGRSVQFFRWNPATKAWVYDGGFTGQFQPSAISTRDVDGDGFGDLVEVTDQGSGVVVFAGKASTYRQVWTSAPSSFDLFSFADFNRNGGTDLVDSHSFFGSTNVGVTVVDGVTGATTVLIADASPTPSSYQPQVLDVNHDGWPDIRVKVVDGDGVKQPNIVFRNKADGTLSFTRS